MAMLMIYLSTHENVAVRVRLGALFSHCNCRAWEKLSVLASGLLFSFGMFALQFCACEHGGGGEQYSDRSAAVPCKGNAHFSTH